jgi:hypothetical protein
MRYSKGISWIDDCRIPFVDDIDLEQKQNQKTNGDKYGGGKGFHKEPIIMQMYKSQGRFPANILVCDDMLNDGNIGKGSGVEKMTVNNHSQTESKYQYSKIKKQFSIADKGSNSRYYDIDKWFNNLIDV